VTEPVLSREEALYGIWLLDDIVNELKQIEELLKDGDEEEED
jgi:hypothetical protein